MDLFAVFLLFAVALIWGLTNPLMKKGSVGIEKCASSESSWVQNFLLEIKFLLMNWKVSICFKKLIWITNYFLLFHYMWFMIYYLLCILFNSTYQLTS